MLIFRNKNSRGFTLIELAIVLGVAGVLFAGLWRLLSSSHVQMRDQSAASTQTQLITAINSYLQTTEGQNYLANINNTALNAAYTNNPVTLSLPSAANPAGSAGCAADANMNGTNGQPLHPGLCNVLPPGFNVNSTNSYGQNYSVGILKDNTTPGTPPLSYSFMVLTSGGDVISDTSGGRISSLIGGDGGFVYSSNVCSAANLTMACGAFGTWLTTVKTYFPAIIAVPNGGVVASRTFYTPTQITNNLWLARYILPGDNVHHPEYNTIHSAANLFLGGNTMYFGCDDSATGNLFGNCLTTGVNAGNIEAQGGIINMEGGNITMFTTPTTVPPTAGQGIITLNGGLITDTSINQAINIVEPTGTNNNIASGGATPINVATGCTINTAVTSGLNNLPDCNPAIQVTGDQFVTGQLTANYLYAQTFIYNSSDMRLKRNIQSLNDPLQEVMQLKPVSFNFRNSGAKGLGVIAQDIEKVYPELVSERPDGMKSVNYDGLIAPLIGAVQELKKENDELKHQLNNQMKKQKELEERLNAQ